MYSETHFSAFSQIQNLRILLPSPLRDGHAKKANFCGCSVDQQAEKKQGLRNTTQTKGFYLYWKLYCGSDDTA